MRKEIRKLLDKKEGDKKSGKVIQVVASETVQIGPLRYGSLSWAASKIEGGEAAFAELIRYSAKYGNEECALFLKAWDSLSADEQLNPGILDAIAREMKLDRETIFGQATKAANRFSMNAARLLAAVRQPAVVTATLNCAEREEADFHRDRKLILESTRFAPTPSGSRTNVQVNNQINNVSESSDGLPEFESSVQETSRLIRGETE